VEVEVAEVVVVVAAFEEVVEAFEEVVEAFEEVEVFKVVAEVATELLELEPEPEPDPELKVEPMGPTLMLEKMT
jgi:hypothetical protein